MMSCTIEGNLPALRTMLEEDPSLVNRSVGYFTPLHFAVRSGNIDSVRLLLEYGADPTERTLGWQDDSWTKAKDRGYEDIANLLETHMGHRYKSSPAGSGIVESIKNRDRDEILRQLNADPESIHTGDERGNRPLHWAVLTRQMWLIDELLSRGADLQAARVDGATPIQLAIDGDYWYRANRDLSQEAIRDQWILVGYLLACGAEYDLCTAASVGDTIHARSLLEAKPGLIHEKNAIGKRPLSYAARSGYLTMLKLLLEYGADPNGDEESGKNGSALWQAAKGNYLDCAQLLLDHGANPNSDVYASGNPLYIAMSNGHDKMVHLLYSYGASVNLDCACCLGRIDLAGEIIRANPSLIESGDYGPLCMAAGYGHTDIVRLLIRSGADLNAVWYANNYMGYALDTGLEMVRLLLDAGADPNNANWQGITYLHIAAWLGNVEYAKLLLDCGAELEPIDQEYGTTPLGWAAKYGRTEMVRFLLSRGANPLLPKIEPWTQPLAWAIRKGYKEIAVLLSNENI
ncbi:ankyrin repeat domain-containing protein [Paenibacillus sp. H1-7]|uniref:ankyrin repeat domain-containing protein n=1 Tax=Paenibacillus sp. H1-7 TaxID=2282849 RepID=UPI001EF9AABE|nr:ankyrin repeat domain-containing protein [Paenibacillus sp. H1-7]ULL16270.1 ankyrin repeat domain-containing protein [Paenibacillus sp. H1-7]